MANIIAKIFCPHFVLMMWTLESITLYVGPSTAIDKLKDVKCAYLAFKGEADYYIPEELLDEAVDGIPDGLGEKMVGKEMGHFPVFEKPEAMAEIVLDFLKKREII